MNFTQDDLVSEDVMMLDTHDSIFIWIGKDSNKDERDKTVQMVMEYLRTGDCIVLYLFQIPSHPYKGTSSHTTYRISVTYH
jgi:hypothetical protein